MLGVNATLSGTEMDVSLGLSAASVHLQSFRCMLSAKSFKNKMLRGLTLSHIQSRFRKRSSIVKNESTECVAGEQNSSLVIVCDSVYTHLQPENFGRNLKSYSFARFRHTYSVPSGIVP